MKENVRPLVSVICAAFNQEEYIAQCLDSLVAQKTEFAFEILVNDDCSTDHTSEIIKSYEERYPHLFRCLYQEENQYQKGLLSWFEFLFPMAKGKYLAICDGDDYWIDPYKLQKQIDFLEANEDYVACFHNARVDTDGSIGLFNSLTECHTPTTLDILRRKWFIVNPSFVCRNIIHTFPDWCRTTVLDDMLLFLLLAKEGRFYYMDDVMAVYRKHATSVSAQLGKNMVNLNSRIIDLYKRVKPLYDSSYHSVIDETIQMYERENVQIQRHVDHPWIKWLEWRTYKRALFKKLRIKRY